MLQAVLIYGLVNSVILVIVALGFNLTFGISGVANFAHGALYVGAGFLTWFGLKWLGLPFILAAAVTVVVTALFAAFLYRYILLRVRGLVVNEVIATFGVGLTFLELFRYFGLVGFEYTLPTFIDAGISVAGVEIDAQRLLILGFGVVMTGFLWVYTRHTRTGLAFRGIAQDERTALTLGINADRIAAKSMAFGGAYAALAAIVVLPLGTISVNEGYNVLTNALAVCIVGGLGSTVGVITASIIIGYAQILTATYLETHWMMIVSLVAILLVLAVKPSGLFGHHKELEERI